MIGEFELDGTTYLNYDGNALIYMLVNAIQEQQQQIEELERTFRKNKINDLNSTIYEVYTALNPSALPQRNMNC